MEYPAVTSQQISSMKIAMPYSSVVHDPSVGVKALALVVFFAVGLLVGCSESESTAKPPPPPSVIVTKPLVEEITEWDAYTGRLQAIQSVEVRARVSGYLESVHFEDGQMVKRGDLLFVIDPRPYQAVLDEAKAQLTRARVQLDLAEDNLARARNLYEQRAISEEELDQRTRGKEGAIAVLQAAQASVRRAKLNLIFTRVRAPVSGRVSRDLVTRGNLISGGSAGATLLTTIVSLDPIYLYFTADEAALLRYIRLARAGQRESSRTAPNPVLMQLSDEEGYPHRGHMNFVDNQVDESTGTIQGRAIFNNPGYLFTPGVFGEILLKGRGPYEALLIPDAAVSADQATRFVYVVDEHNVVQRRDLALGRWVDDRFRVVEDGLKPNDRIIVEGLLLVQPGVPVTPQMHPMKDPGTGLMATAE
jgi:RND family efflux transporter MFP subunit